MCVCCAPFSMVTMLEHYEIYLWLQGLRKHVSVTANVIYIAYCLVVLSISLITAFICDVFMWFWWQFVLVSFHFWSIKSINIDLDVWNLACSIIISCCWTRTDILIFFDFLFLLLLLLLLLLFIMKDEWVNVRGSFYF